MKCWQMRNIVIPLSDMRYVLFFILILVSCADEGEIQNVIPPVEVDAPNILFIIADDLGKDAINGFTEGSIKPTTPNLDAIRTSGISFENFWSYPTCSPTRATIITGKYGYRTNVKWANDELDPSETILQKYIAEHTENSYASAIVGKWHLSGGNTSINPESFGLDYFAGLIRGQPKSYTNWQLYENGASTNMTTYITSALTDLAIDWIDNQEKPWFMWLAYNAPHTPFHVPPNGLHTQGNLPVFMEGMDEMPYYLAAIEAMDYEIGRLLGVMTQETKENTIIIFIGDNGSPNEVAQSPYNFFTAKGSLNQGGVNVPMFISGKGISNLSSNSNLITSTDLFATIAEMAGVSIDEIHDSKSFKSLLTASGETDAREYQYAEKDDGENNLWAISNGTYKLIINANGEEAFFHLLEDPYEQTNLMDRTLTNTEVEVKLELETEISIIRN